ncbi:unnamed protein product, partial [Nesidiocoris tenuis]
MPEKEPIKLSSYLKRCDESTKANPVPNRSGLAWNHDYSLAAIANASGVLYIVKGRTFEHLHTSRAHKKLIQCVVWHPATVTSKTGLSPYNTWLASAGENVCVMNVTSSGVDIIASLNSHTEKIACVAWSPHINGLLITASNDRTSLVWDVVSTAVLARFNAHHGSVLCALPSPCHQDFVITGSVDSTVRVWDSKKFQLSEAGAQETSLSKAVEKCTETSRAPEQLSISMMGFEKYNLFFVCLLMSICWDVGSQDAEEITEEYEESPDEPVSSLPVEASSTTKRPKVTVGTTAAPVRKKTPCLCTEGQCKCCTGALLQRFNYTLRNKACVNVNYNPDDFEFHYKLVFNERVLYQNKMS